MIYLLTKVQPIVVPRTKISRSHFAILSLYLLVGNTHIACFISHSFSTSHSRGWLLKIDNYKRDTIPRRLSNRTSFVYTIRFKVLRVFFATIDILWFKTVKLVEIFGLPMDVWDPICPFRINSWLVSHSDRVFHKVGVFWFSHLRNSSIFANYFFSNLNF